MIFFRSRHADFSKLQSELDLLCEKTARESQGKTSFDATEKALGYAAFYHWIRAASNTTDKDHLLFANVTARAFAVRLVEVVNEDFSLFQLIHKAKPSFRPATEIVMAYQRVSENDPDWEAWASSTSRAIILLARFLAYAATEKFGSLKAIDKSQPKVLLDFGRHLAKNVFGESASDCLYTDESMFVPADKWL